MTKNLLVSRARRRQIRLTSTLEVAFSVGLALSALARPATAQCYIPFWSSQFATTATGLGGAGDCLAVFDPDGPGPLPAELYVGGYFQTAGGVAAKGIARWNGQNWAAVGGGVNGSVQALCLFDADGPGPGLPVLVAVGAFSLAGGVPAANIASWNGAQWSPIGPGLPDMYGAICLTEHDPDGAGSGLPFLIVGAEIINGVDPEGVAQWNGTTWSSIPGSPTSVKALASFDEDGPGPLPPMLFVGGFYPPGVHRWDGSTWQVPGGGLTRSAQYMCASLRVVDEDGPGPALPVLLAGGWFTIAGGTPALAIARWNGAAWSAMGSGIGTGQAIVKDIVAVDYTGGSGAPTIYAYALWPDYPASGDSGLLRWEPASLQWSILGRFPQGSATLPARLASFSGSSSLPSLYVTSGFSSVNSIASQSIARLGCDCAANCDHSAANPILTANDFQCFLNAYAAGDPYANCDGSTAIPVLTANDFQCFLTAFAVGCT